MNEEGQHSGRKWKTKMLHCGCGLVVERNHRDFHGALDLKILLIKKFFETEGWACRTVQTRGKEVLYYTSRFWGTQQQKSNRLGYERQHPLSYRVIIWF